MDNGVIYLLETTNLTDELLSAILSVAKTPNI